jgi:hypothetical protein
MDIEFYAQRLLNPFRGVTNTVKYHSAEAVSTDGVNWDIYVSNDLLLEDLDTNKRIQTSDIRYGKWSYANGLKRGPIYPSDDFKYLEHQGAIVLDYVQKHHTDVPFPLADTFELWLLDRNHMPLALLDSVVAKQELDNERNLVWRAGNLCRKTFQASTLQDLLSPSDSAVNSADYLSQYINDQASDPPAAQWFERDPAGNAQGLFGINLVDELQTRHLPARDFPVTLLSRPETDVLHQQLIDEFLNWQAPWLLLLPSLDVETRGGYELAARAQALVVEQQYRLYPEIVDMAAINTARVEARFRNSLAEPEEEENILSTWYLELNPSSME